MKKKLPRTHSELKDLIAQAEYEASARTAAIVKQEAASRFAHYQKEHNEVELKIRRQAIESLSRMGQAIAEIAMALSKVVEPRQI